jgi:hypothetical protein
MDVNSCITCYQQLSKEIFKRGWQFPGKPIWDAYCKKPWFKAEDLERSIKTVIESNLSPQEKEMLAGKGITVDNAPYLDPGLAPGDICNVYTFPISEK